MLRTPEQDRLRVKDCQQKTSSKKLADSFTIKQVRDVAERLLAGKIHIRPSEESRLRAASTAKHLHLTQLASVYVVLNELPVTAGRASGVAPFENRALAAYDALSETLPDSYLHVAYVGLHSVVASPVETLVSDKREKTRLGASRLVVRTRANPVMINRFTRHGRKESALSGYARALSHIMCMLKAGRYGELHAVSALAHKNFLFGRKPISIDDVLTINAGLSLSRKKIAVRSRYHTLNELFESDLSAASSELVQRNLSRLSPAYTVRISRIPKKRYKNIRNKTSRYEARDVAVPRRAVLAY